MIRREHNWWAGDGINRVHSSTREWTETENVVGESRAVSRLRVETRITHAMQIKQESSMKGLDGGCVSGDGVVHHRWKRVGGCLVPEWVTNGLRVSERK